MLEGLQKQRVLIGGADGQAQAVGQQRVHFRNVFNQHPLVLERLKNGRRPLGGATQAQQHHVGIAAKGRHARQGRQRSQQPFALGDDDLREGINRLASFVTG